MKNQTITKTYLDQKFKAQDKRFEKKFKTQDERLDAKFELQNRRFDAKFAEQNKKLTEQGKRTDNLIITMREGFEEARQDRQIIRAEMETMEKRLSHKIDNSQSELARITKNEFDNVHKRFEQIAQGEGPLKAIFS